MYSIITLRGDSMVDGTSALKFNNNLSPVSQDGYITSWTWDEYWMISQKLKQHGCAYLKGREEYILLKEVVSDNVTEVSNFGKNENTQKPVFSMAEGSGVNSPLCLTG